MQVPIVTTIVYSCVYSETFSIFNLFWPRISKFTTSVFYISEIWNNIFQSPFCLRCYYKTKSIYNFSLFNLWFKTLTILLWVDIPLYIYIYIYIYISNKMQRYTVYFIRKLLYMFRVVLPPIIRSANNCIHSNGMTNTRCVDTVSALLMMGGGTTRNMSGSFQIK
jgi:hypothetical protein